MPLEGKTDMERIGLFSELGYISIGDKYTTSHNRPFNVSASKNKQMLSGSTKKKSALQVGYFDSQFTRIYEKEAYSDPLKLRRQQKLQESKKNIGKAFLPTNGEKTPSGSGNHYGTFGGPVQAMSALQIPKKPYKSPGKNFLTNPSKLGTGYGYPNVTLSKQYSYSADPYERARELKRVFSLDKTMYKGGAFRLNLHPKDFFDANPYKTDKHFPPVSKSLDRKQDVKPFKPSSPAKKVAGMKAGTFDPYPSHSADHYTVKKPKSINTNSAGIIFHPTPGPKSMPVRSIMNANVLKSVTPANYTSISSIMSY